MNYIKDSISNATRAATKTPFVQDVANGGLFGVVTATHRGIEREGLKKKISELETRFSESLKTNIDGLLLEYDKHCEKYTHKDLVLGKREILARKLNILINDFNKHNEHLSEDTNEELLIILDKDVAADV